MCQNYETNLTIMQDNERRLNEEIKAIKGLSGRYESDLANEREYRMELERKMNEERLTIHIYIKLATDNKDAARDSLKQKKNLEKLLESRSTLNWRINTRNCSAQIELLPKKCELNLSNSRMIEDMIELKSAKQHVEHELRDDNALLREQLFEERRAREGLERDLLGQVNDLQTELGIANSQLTTAGNALMMGDEHKRQIRDLHHTVAELEAQVAQVQNERSAVEITAQNYKARCSSLQMELDNSEIVQKDFVKLSQSLQIQLEKIRQSEQEVRWQWEDEVENCSGCSTSVNKLKPKPRCHHCGKCFCVNCVKQTVPSGNSRRPAPVCQVCHTLLNRDSKPFFAQDPPK